MSGVTVRVFVASSFLLAVSFLLCFAFFALAAMDLISLGGLPTGAVAGLYAK